MRIVILIILTLLCFNVGNAQGLTPTALAWLAPLNHMITSLIGFEVPIFLAPKDTPSSAGTSTPQSVADAPSPETTTSQLDAPLQTNPPQTDPSEQEVAAKPSNLFKHIDIPLEEKLLDRMASDPDFKNMIQSEFAHLASKLAAAA